MGRRSLPEADPVRYRMVTRSDRKERPVHARKPHRIGAQLGLALALALSGTGPAAAQNLGERIGGALNRSAQAVGRAAERAGSATGAAADRSLGWAQRKVRGEPGGRDRESRRAAQR
jgi:hypothetical protein